MKTFKNLFLLFFLMSISAGYALTNYCATPVVSTSGGYTVNFTCRNVSGTTYEYKLEFANAVTSIDNANIGANTSSGTFNIGSNLVLSNGNKTVSVQFTSTTAPSLYVNYIALTVSGSQRVWNELPKDANWAATCLTTPVLTTTAATSITNTGGTMNGNISSIGASNLTSYGFYWSTVSGFANGAGTQVQVGTTGTFTGNISSALASLASGTPYYYKAYATNSSGTAYGAQQTFTTTSPNPAPTFGAWTLPAKTTADGNFTITPPTTNSTGAITYTSATTSVATIVSVNQIHIVGAGTSLITLNQAADGTHASGSTTATLTVTAITTPPAGPTNPPARNAWDVLSEYGAAYTNQTGVAFFDFGGSTIVGDVTLADGKIVKKYTNHLYSGIGVNGALDLNVSAMTTLHMDVWSPDFVGFRVKLEAVNGSNVELDVPGVKTQGSWNSYDIPLSSYSAVDLTNLRYIVPVSNDGAGRILFISNVYFYRPATSLPPPTLGTFTVPAKNVGDADFTLTPPTTNSTGAWSYTSGTTSVATVTGSTVHIVGGGTSTITATQAADASHSVGTASASFVVNIPPLATPAPTPPARATSDYMSVYSNAYTPVLATVNTNPNWGQATVVTTETIGSDNLLKYTNLNYQGTDFGGNIDVSGMSYVHIDVYTTNETSLDFYLISSTTGERPVALTPITLNGWNSYDIPLTSYTSQSGFTVNSIFQFKMVGSGGKTIYVDNMYFWKPAATFTNPTITFSDINKVLGDSNFTVSASSNSPGAITYTSSNTAVATITGNTVHIVGAGTSTITANQAASGTYNPGSAAATLTVTVPPLTTAAPTPPARNPWDTVSIYSNAYTTTGSPAWSADATVEDVQLSGNDTKKISNFLIETVEFGAQDLTAMTMMHVDVYSDDCTGMNLWLLNNGDRNAQRTITLNQWNSFDIPLSTYTALGLNLNGVHLLKFESLNGSGKTIYVDNVYFYRPATLLPPTLSNFTIPTQAYNSPNYTITPPTSNSSGTFSYTSSNTAVATIVNTNQIHMIGGGTSTITATQAAAGSYGSGSITTTLTVTYPAPGPSPIPPARTPDRVVSMYTGTPPVYANAATAVESTWTTGTTMTEIPNGTNTALQLDNFGFLGFVDQNETHFGATGMSNLHLDVYLNTPLSNLSVYLLANGDYLYSASNLTAGWNSLSIPLSNFSGADLSQVWGLKLEQTTGNPIQMYLDNVYFSNECYTYYQDLDADGFGNPAVSQQVCGDGSPAPTGYVLDNTDCNDSQVMYADVDGDGFGSTTKVACNGVTNHTDCNDAVTYYTDADGDGFGTLPKLACGTVTNNSDCNDAVTYYTDADGDGFGTLPKLACGTVTNNTDCNDAVTYYTDNDGDGFGTLPKLACGTVTNNTDCNDAVTYYTDADGDGFGILPKLSCGTVTNNTDCNDAVTYYTDADGDGFGVLPKLACGTVTNNTDCNDNDNTKHASFTFYADADGDGFGAGTGVSLCAVNATTPPAGYSINNTDCNDSQVMYADADGDGFGSTTKVACNGVTNNTDCNDAVVYYQDLDNDGFGSNVKLACGTVTNNTDCNDSLVMYADVDGDGFGSTTKVACAGVTNNTDCNDASASVYQTLTVYVDADHDGYGTGSALQVCSGSTPGVGYSANNTDCNDNAATAHPGAVEIGYNLIDDDCDGLIDEGFPPKNTTITGSMCGLTLPALDTQLYADVVAGAQGYQWKITTMSGASAGQVQILNTALRVMKLTQLATYAYATTYKVEVAVYYAGYLQPYFASTCSVSTPAITTQLSACPQQALTTMSDVIYANVVPFATGYRFTVTDPANASNTQTIDRPLREFRMNLVTAFVVQFNKVYNIEVAAKNTDGTYLPFSTSGCTVKTPVFPTTSIDDSQCDSYAPPTMATPIYAVSYPGAIAYGFNLSGNNFGTTGVEVVKSTRTFKLSDFTGLIPGATYNVRVRLVFNANDPAGLYGKTCTVTVPGASKIAQPGIETASIFNAVAYPNPFADGFNISVTTSAQEKIVIKVYDMTGRLLENRSVTTSEVKSLTVGENYPSGVYNVIVGQGDEVKTLRVVKR